MVTRPAAAGNAAGRGPAAIIPESSVRSRPREVRRMDKKQMMNVLVPALAAAAVVVLVGLLIVSGDGGPGSSGSGKDAAASARQVAAADRNDSGMSDGLPPTDTPEWKPGPGGMKVWDVREGDGEPCPPNATVTIHYTGWTLDGNTFDSSRRRGEPTTFPLGNLIKGWQEGIPGMKPGAVRRLTIPPEWAYGERGSPPNIPPNATLVFEVKLLGWQK